MERCNRARALRLRYSVSLLELANASGISPQTVSKIELEPERQTPYHERLMRNAFAAVIARRRDELDRLEQELSADTGLFQTYEEV